MIGLSPLPSAHWNTFQRIPIRTSIRCYPDFILAKGRSPGFASTPADSTPSSDSLSLRLRGSCRLTSPARVTRRFIMQKARRHPTTGAPTACRRTGSGSVSLPCSGFFSPFPHGTGSLSVSYSGYRPPDESLRVRGSHPLRPPFPGAFHSRHGRLTTVLQPRRRLDAGGLGSSAFARHYSRNHCYFLLLWVLRCFSSPRSPPPRGGCRAYARRVAPFGNPGIKGYLLLPRDYRGLSRPSSPPRA